MQRTPLFTRPAEPPRSRKRSADRIVEGNGRKLLLSTIGQSRHWYDALRLSPSYELARLHNAGELPPGMPLPADFDKVLTVYGDLGDVRKDIDRWTNDHAFRAFGYGGQKPAVAKLGIMRLDENADIATTIDGYSATAWMQQGERTTLIAAIPAGLPRAQITKQLMAMLDEIPKAERELSPMAPRYKMGGGKHSLKSAQKYIKCLKRRAMQPHLTLWQIGALEKLSRMHSKWLDPAVKPTGDDQIEARDRLKILTSRAIKRGHMIAENAARGVFPSYADCPTALPIDWLELGRRLA